MAAGLADARGCLVNDLPPRQVVSWFKQNLGAMLLALLYLNVKGIKIDPKPPEFVSPNVFKVLQEKVDLCLSGPSAQKDLRLVMVG
jgi:hydroxylamine reductase